MKPSLFPIALATVSMTLTGLAADPSSDTEKDDAKKREEPASPVLAHPPAAASPAKEASAQGAPTPTPPAGTEVAATATPPPSDNTTMLPQVEVNKSRITNLDIEINEKQRAIDREKQRIKPTKLDDTLNNSKLSKTLSIFGGSSSDSRSSLAQERVQIMQEEKEILEAMKTTQSKEEKAELEMELDLLRQSRRELEQGAK